MWSSLYLCIQPQDLSGSKMAEALMPNFMSMGGAVFPPCCLTWGQACWGRAVRALKSAQHHYLSGNLKSNITEILKFKRLITSLEHYLGASTIITGEKTLYPTGLWQAQSKEQAPPNIKGGLWSLQYQPDPLSRGQWPAHPEERQGGSIPKIALTPKILDSWRRHRDAPKSK